jgi:hypothetical protein
LIYVLFDIVNNTGPFGGIEGRVENKNVTRKNVEEIKEVF